MSGIEKKQLSKNRIEWVDFAKGITMLLVIVAHTMQGGIAGSVVRGVIYSFHMPLFFILSGFTTSMPKSGAQFVKRTKKAFISLIIPGVLLYVAWVCIELVRGLGSISDGAFWQGKLLTLLFASASSTVWGETFISGIGMIWFFFVMFWGKMLYEGSYLLVGKVCDKANNQVIQKYILTVISIVFSIIGMIFGRYCWLPFSFDVAMGIQPFYVMGLWLRDYDLKKKTGLKLLMWAVLWGGCFYITYPHLSDWTYLEVGLRRYSVFPISFIAALAGVVLVGLKGCILQNISLKQHALGKIVSRFLKACYILGEKSMYLLCIHIMDQLWDFIWYQEGHQFVSMGLRVGSDILIFVAVYLVKKVILADNHIIS